MTGQPDSREPLLVACSHGTASPDGQRAVLDLCRQVSDRRPGLEVVAAYVDAQEPAVADVVRRLADQGRRSVIVPMLLSTGYHVQVDIAAAVAGSGGRAVATATLGPDPALVGVLLDRLVECGTGADDIVLLAAAGSTDPRATTDVEQVAAALGDRLGRPVGTGYLSAAQPRLSPAVAEAVAVAAVQGRAVTVATYLLSPGIFADRLSNLATVTGAARVSAPLAGHRDVAALVLRRYDEAVAAAGGGTGAGGLGLGRPAR